MKRTTKPFFIQFFLMPLVIIFLLATHSAYARPAYAVELISFTAVGIVNGVELRWETATELGAAAFQLQRGQGANYVNLAQLVDENGQPYAGGIIEAEGSPTFGATYIARDVTAVPGQTYAYQLIEIESDNNTTVIASVTVLAGATATPTQITIGGNNTPGPGNQNSSTPTAVTSTPMPTTTPRAQASATSTRTIILTAPVAENDFSDQTTAPSDGAGSNSNPDSSEQLIIPTSTTSGIVEIAQIQPTPESAYPGETTPSEAENGYPEAVVTPLTITTTVTAYPVNGSSSFLPEQQPTPTIIGVVGSQTNGVAPVISTGQPVTTSASSTGVLWFGFLAGLLIFGIAIAGSILLFVRRRQ